MVFSNAFCRGFMVLLKDEISIESMRSTQNLFALSSKSNQPKSKSLLQL
jgi:hypothetical protein